MISNQKFFKTLLNNGIDFFTGVPDSLLKNICAYITDHTDETHHIIAANEGGAIALGTGYNLATGKIPLIYMQNSGIGNAVNPLLSLADKEVYSIPMLLLIGWRGEPGLKDEPQHIKQGRVTTNLLKAMEIPYSIIDENSEYKSIIEKSVGYAQKNSSPIAILVRKNTFASYKLKRNETSSYQLTREEALNEILIHIPHDSTIISTTGKLSRELFELREKNNQSHMMDFLTVGSMGHTSQIALGVALAKPEKNVFCFDGDGSVIMHLGHYAITGKLAPQNLKLIVFNNGSHDSVGGQPTIGQWINLPRVAEAFNIENFGCVNSKKEIQKILPELIDYNKISFLEVRIKKGARRDLGRPTISPLQNKELFKRHIYK